MIAMTPSTPSVRAAFFDCGRLKALTPFAIASTPVRALAPEENAFRIRKMPRAPAPGASSCGETARGQPVVAHFVTPTPTARSIEPMNRYVGIANTRPDSRTPRRLTSVIRTTAPSERAVSYACREVTADVIASTPLETETATVNT